MPYKKKKKKNSRGKANTQVKHGRLARWLKFDRSKCLWGGCIVFAAAYAYFIYSWFVQPFGFRWKALYGDPVYPQGYEIHGIDISHHQGKIDWVKLRNAMVDRTYLAFIMVKATEGADYLDECFDENFKMAKEGGYIRGAYHYWSTLSSAREQAYFFLDKVKLLPGDLPPVLDVENKPESMSDEDFQMEILAWLHIVEDRYHKRPIIYTYYKFKEAYLSDERFDDYPYWIAHYYVPEVQYEGKWKFWQHTDVGRLPGIKGYVDLNIYNGSYYDLEQLTLKEEDLFVPEIETADSLDYETNDSIAQEPEEELD